MTYARRALPTLILTKDQKLLWQKTGEGELGIVVLEPPAPRGAQAMRDFARRFRAEPQTTAEWGRGPRVEPPAQFLSRAGTFAAGLDFVRTRSSTLRV